LRRPGTVRFPRPAKAGRGLGRGAAEREDDRIEDKHPVLDPSLTVNESFDSCAFTLNKSGSVTKLSVAPYEGDQKSLGSKLFPSRGAALAALQALPDADVIPSMETVNGHLKPFNDGLYAAIEIAMEDGVSAGFGGKRKLLGDILSALQAARPSATPVAQSVLDSAAAFVPSSMPDARLVLLTRNGT